MVMNWSDWNVKISGTYVYFFNRTEINLIDPIIKIDAGVSFFTRLHLY